MSRGGRGRGRGRSDSKFPTFEGQIQFASAPPPLFPVNFTIKFLYMYFNL